MERTQLEAERRPLAGGAGEAGSASIFGRVQGGFWRRRMVAPSRANSANCCGARGCTRPC